jgi:ribulose-5-phosphate 4-epimerase/fuculose-1-phosphate aldolase
MYNDQYAPALPKLSPRQEYALLARVLHREGYADHIAGHITYRLPDDTLLTNPVRLTWDEIRAGDVMHVDLDGNVLDGPWTVTPALGLHLEMHRARPDIKIAVHNHPQWGVIWADRHAAPPAYDQTSALVHGEIAVFDEYDGTFVERVNAQRAVAAVGTANYALLANHGVLVLAPDVEQAYLRAFALEWRCRSAWHVEALGDGIPLKPDVAEAVGARFREKNMIGLWEAVVRRELRRDPSVLDHRPTRVEIPNFN